MYATRKRIYCLILTQTAGICKLRTVTAHYCKSPSGAVHASRCSTAYGGAHLCTILLQVSLQVQLSPPSTWCLGRYGHDCAAHHLPDPPRRPPQFHPSSGEGGMSFLSSQ